MILPILAIVGVVVSLHDGDGPIHVRTETGNVSIRLQGIQAPDFETAAPCRQHRAEYVCDDRLAAASRDKLAWIVGRRITCEPTGHNYTRIVAWCSVDGRDLSCEQVRSGAAERWARYDRGGRLIDCERRR